MTQDQPPRPANMRRIVAINQGRLPTSDEAAPARSLTRNEAQALVQAGAVALDARSPQSFGAGHLPGAINVWVEAETFEQALGWILPGDERVVLIADDEGAAREALDKLAFVGLDQRVEGWIAVGDWPAAAEAERLPTIDVRTAATQIEQGRLQVVDVRAPDEFRAGHVEGAVNVDYRQLPGRIHALGLDPSRPVAVYCGGGMRSAIGASILRRGGFASVCNVAGGMSAWRKAGLPVEPGE